jgi:phosphinothricin acetyltransferase
MRDAEALRQIDILRGCRHSFHLVLTMNIRVATPTDADAITAIYAPVVASSSISFELTPPSVDEMRERIVKTLPDLPWLVSEDAQGSVDGYVYASKHRERAAYQWSVDVTAYVREDARGTGVGKRLYRALFDELARLGYFQAFAGIALPNAASVALHESVGFEPIGVYSKVGFKLGAWHDVGWWQRELREPIKPTAPTPFKAGG